jgi:hypothetical protein
MQFQDSKVSIQHSAISIQWQHFAVGRLAFVIERSGERVDLDFFGRRIPRWSSGVHIKRHRSGLNQSSFSRRESLPGAGEFHVYIPKQMAALARVSQPWVRPSVRS